MMYMIYIICTIYVIREPFRGRFVRLYVAHATVMQLAHPPGPRSVQILPGGLAAQLGLRKKVRVHAYFDAPQPF